MSDSLQIPLDCLQCPWVIIGTDGVPRFRKMLVENSEDVIGSGGNTPVRAKDFAPYEYLVDQRGRLKLDQGTNRIPAASNLPATVEGFYDDRPYYRTNRVSFLTADWNALTLKLYIPLTHAFYGTYTDDDPPMVQVYKRTGATGGYIYTLYVPSSLTVTYGFRAASLIGDVDTAEPLVSAWQSIADGEFSINIDGKTQTPTGLDFTGDAAMSDVAATITAGLTGCTCTWETDHFKFVSTASTGNTNISHLMKLQEGSGTDISGTGWLACTQFSATLTAGINGGWMVTLTDAVAAFDGLIQIG